MEKKITSIRIGKRTEEGLATLRQAWGMTLSETISVLVEKEIANMKDEKTVWDVKVGNAVLQILEVSALLPEAGGMSIEQALETSRKNNESLDSAEWAEVERQVAEACGVTL